MILRELKSHWWPLSWTEKRRIVIWLAEEWDSLALSVIWDDNAVYTSPSPFFPPLPQDAIFYSTFLLKSSPKGKNSKNSCTGIISSGHIHYEQCCGTGAVTASFCIGVASSASKCIYFF
jgi:hypothetical protein